METFLLVLDWIALNPIYSLFLTILGFFLIVFIRDTTQTKHTIKHNFPVVGHLRYFLEKIGPELRQYWVAHDKEEKPFDRTERRWIYSTAKGENSNFGFGSNELQYEPGYPIIKQKAFPYPEEKAHHILGDKSCIPSLKVMGEFHKRKYPFRPYSIVNVSAMSYGALSKNAITALNKGCLQAGAFHNTGEGGISPYHQNGADLVWQIGTGYFGARDASGRFNINVLKEKVESIPHIRAIEIKLSQGAKPGKGGILPGKKVNEEVARIRHVSVGEDVISPNSHSAFSNVKEMIDFIEMLAEETGLPVGIKSAVGEIEFWEELAKEMKKQKRGPDFIAIDGGEGGTGAAPLTYADHVSLPFKIAFQRVYTTFQKQGVSERIVWIGAGKLGFPDRAVVALAMGCDLIYVAREAMLAVGCIQALVCHTDRCPAGVATQNWWLSKGLNPENKSDRAGAYLKGFRKELLSLAHSCGYEHPSQFTGLDIEISVGMNKYITLEEQLGYKKDPIRFGKMEDYSDFPVR